jgi:hypothetical protein
LTDIATLAAFTYESLRAELEQWRAEFVTRNGSKPRAEDIKAAGTDTGVKCMHCSCQVFVGTATTLGNDASINLMLCNIGSFANVGPNVTVLKFKLYNKLREEKKLNASQTTASTSWVENCPPSAELPSDSQV